MRKRIISPAPQENAPPEEDWLNLEDLAQVEFTSEDAEYPIETALLPGTGSGWRAAQAGEQTIRLNFDRPQQLNRIRLLFLEPDAVRTQEFTLRWSPDGGQSFREIVRQQWNFSPPDATREVEDYRVELSGVTILELTIVPDMSRGESFASLAQMRLA
ncbi:MAG: hypothetical protein MOB07_22890 [Acidobacteria bacterium]|nr:hypothetical protein [Acidobacteriota bacterium]